MKNGTLKYSISTFLSILIIIVQVGFVQTTHICGGKAVLSEFGLGESDLHCGGNIKKSKEEVSCDNKNHSITKKPCCRNSSLSIKLDDKFQKKSFSEINFIPLIVTFVFKAQEEAQAEKIPFQNNEGFIQTKDIPIWNQAFLI